MEKKKGGRSVDLISDCPGVLLRDGGGEGAEDLLQGQASILIQPKTKGRRHIYTNDDIIARVADAEDHFMTSRKRKYSSVQQKTEHSVVFQTQRHCCGAGAEEPKFYGLPEPEPKLRIAAPALVFFLFIEDLKKFYRKKSWLRKKLL